LRFVVQLAHLDLLLRDYILRHSAP
jgi:hypothetical protein